MSCPACERQDQGESEVGWRCNGPHTLKGDICGPAAADPDHAVTPPALSR
jgi:hypothetical protein